MVWSNVELNVILYLKSLYNTSTEVCSLAAMMEEDVPMSAD